jgi:murein tripeptide amidase MpaA
VLLVAPIFNADGNERVALGNRPHQHGPVGGMGTRANAQGLNINRDFSKLETPEARSQAR